MCMVCLQSLVIFVSVVSSLFLHTGCFLTSLEHIGVIRPEITFFLPTFSQNGKERFHDYPFFWETWYFSIFAL